MVNSPIFSQPGAAARTPWLSAGSSLTIHVCVIAAIIVVPSARYRTIPVTPGRVSVVRLLAPPKPVMVSKASVQAFFKPRQLQVAPPKQFVPPPVPRQQIIPAPIPPPEALVAGTSVPAQAPPVIKHELLSSGNIAAPEPKAPVHEVKTGGFGDPNGIPTSAATGRGLTVAKLGSFDLPQGAGNGGAHGTGVVVGGFGTGVPAGTGNGGARATGVVVGGFGAGVPAGTGPAGAGSGAVRPVGFGEYDKPPTPKQEVSRTAPPATTPVEILSKPKPAYSEAARAKKLEGEVTLEVLFGANGEIRVLRLVSGLGSGLDENAESAAARIRFRPGTRDGRPVDMKGIVRIVFQLL